MDKSYIGYSVYLTLFFNNYYWKKDN